MSDKIDGRKRNSAETMAKKSAAGKLGMGVNAVTPKYKSKRDMGLPARIEMVVAMAKEADAKAERGEQESINGQDPIRHNRARMSFRVKGSKIG